MAKESLRKTIRWIFVIFCAVSAFAFFREGFKTAPIFLTVPAFISLPFSFIDNLWERIFRLSDKQSEDELNGSVSDTIYRDDKRDVFIVIRVVVPVVICFCVFIAGLGLAEKKIDELQTAVSHLEYLKEQEETTPPESEEYTESTQDTAEDETEYPEEESTQVDKTTQSSQGSEGEEAAYILNRNTRKFHFPSCPDAKKIKSGNRIDYEGTREKVVENGYSPCGHCKP